MISKKIAVLAGDGIGPEVMKEAVQVLTKVSKIYNHEFLFQEGLIGGAAYEHCGTHFPHETLEICKNSDAILYGSVGGPVSEQHLDKWKSCEVNSLLGIRKAFNFNANFRPVRIIPELSDLCPLKDEIVKNGVDLLVIRELLGDIYFGNKRSYEENGQRMALDECSYSEDQIRSIAHVAFKAAEKRRHKVTSIDKANVLYTSKLWREIVKEVHQDYPKIELEHMLVDNAAMQLIKNPSSFDVLLCSNMFGDILSDAAAVLPGSLGLMASASLNSAGFGMFEPPGGSAQDIAGKQIANPIGQILSASLMLKFTFGMINESESIEKAVAETISQGYRTGDMLRNSSKKAISTSEMGSAIIKNLKAL